MKDILQRRPVLNAVAIGGAVLIVYTCFAFTGPNQVQNKSRISPLNWKVNEGMLNRDQPYPRQLPVN